MFWAQSQRCLVQFSVVRQVNGYAEKTVWGKRITHVATSYRLKIFHRHLFLKGKIGFCENIFFPKKLSAFCRKLELFIRKPNTCKPNISGWKYWFGVLLLHLSGGWQFGASFPHSLWGGSQRHIFTALHGWAQVGTGAHAAKWLQHVTAMLPVKQSMDVSWFLPPLFLQG